MTKIKDYKYLEFGKEEDTGYKAQNALLNRNIITAFISNQGPADGLPQ